MTNDPSSAPSTHIQGVDPQGRPIQIEREEFRANVLPGLIKASESDPERLTAVIMQGLREGFADDLIAAANRLTVIDKNNMERALTVLAVVQRDSGELDLAESTLQELLQRHPGSPAGYVGLGMLKEKQGDLDGCEALLMQALLFGRAKSYSRCASALDPAPWPFLAGSALPFTSRHVWYHCSPCNSATHVTTQTAEKPLARRTSAGTHRRMAERRAEGQDARMSRRRGKVAEVAGFRFGVGLSSVALLFYARTVGLS